MKYTSKQLAEICKVSRGTVDRALNNRPGISEETRKLVLNTAKKLNYKPDYIASSLKRGRTDTIGIVIFDLYNPFFSHLLNVMEIIARDKGYFVYITLTNRDIATENSCIRHLLDRRVDGIIICSVNTADSFKELNITVPVLSVTNKISEQIPFIGIDDFSAQKNATDYVLSRGYKKIIFVATPLALAGKMNIYATEKRYAGFLESTRQSKDKTIEVTVLKTPDWLDKIIPIIKSSETKPAVICTSDILALNLMRRLTAEGIHVPDQVGLMGFDNIFASEYVVPRLSTVSQDINVIGRSAVNGIINLIEGKAPDLGFINHEIVYGASL